MRFSVVLTLYGNSPYAYEQINSILMQSHPIDELVVVVDKGPEINENVLKLLNNFKDVQILYNKKNLGPAKTFEVAAKNSNGDYVLFCDQDDIWYKSKVDYINKFLKNNNVDIIIHNALVLGNDKMFKEGTLIYKKPPKLIYSLIKNKIIGATMVVKSSVLNHVLTKSGFFPMHDIVLIIAAIKNGLNVSFIMKPLMKYRRHNMTVTGRKSFILKKIFNLIKFRLYYLKVWRNL